MCNCSVNLVYAILNRVQGKSVQIQYLHVHLLLPPFIHYPPVRRRVPLVSDRVHLESDLSAAVKVRVKTCGHEKVAAMWHNSLPFRVLYHRALQNNVQCAAENKSCL
jgi:hypothetical protein